MYDKDMKIYKEFDVVTSDKEESFDLGQMVGEKAAHAYHINHSNFGYGKFIIDQKSFCVFQKQGIVCFILF